MITNTLRALGFFVLAGLSASHSVSAQTMLKAQIPFPFRASGAYLPSGDYTVSARSPSVVVIRNDSTRQSVLLMQQYPLDYRETGVPRLVFNCMEHACALSQLWMGVDRGVQLTVPRMPANPESLIATRKVALKP